MFPYEFEYVRAENVEHALSLLVDADGDAKLLAGGHTLIPMMKMRMATPTLLVDIAGLSDLAGISVDEQKISIGAMSRHAELIQDSTLNAAVPLFGILGEQIADRQVRNRGTIGGALVNADPSADWPAAAMLLDFEFIVLGPHGERRIAAHDFFEGIMTTAVGEDEVLLRVEFARPAPSASYSYHKFRHPASGYAVAGVAAMAVQDHDSTITHCAVAITGVSDASFRAVGTEKHLVGTRPDLQRIADAADMTVNDIDCLSDGYADAAYRQNLATTLSKRALQDVLSLDG